MQKHKKKGYRIGIKWKMFAILVVFIVCTLVSVWFFQVGMLNFFYQNAKFYELEQSADALTEALADGRTDIKQEARLYSEKYDIQIWILKMHDERNAEYAVYPKNFNTSDIVFWEYKMWGLHSAAINNGGTYIATVTEEDFVENSEMHVLEDNSGNMNSFPSIAKHSDAIVTFYVKNISVEDTQYTLLLKGDLSPLQATVSTLRFQFTFIGVTMGIMSLLLAAFMSKLITKPFVKMNESAKSLARGDYATRFEGKGYREIDELAQTLNFASEELAKTDNLQKELISNISHDLRTPLTMIKGYSEVMRDIPGENTPENIQVIIDETTRLANLVNDMLDLSRLQSGTRQMQPEEFSLTSTVRETLSRYEKLTMQEGYKIEFSEDGDAVVFADRGMILQAVYNLINNAINYTGEDKRVRVLQMQTTDFVRLEVSDTGEGIAEKDIRNIWDRYYRVDKVHKRATVGTGLGLSIVKGVLESHSARYGVYSVAGTGSTFWFELPLHREDQAYVEIIDAEYDSACEGGNEKSK